MNVTFFMAIVAVPICLYMIYQGVPLPSFFKPVQNSNTKKYIKIKPKGESPIDVYFQKWFDGGHTYIFIAESGKTIAVYSIGLSACLSVDLYPSEIEVDEYLIADSKVELLSLAQHYKNTAMCEDIISILGQPRRVE